MLLEGVWTSVPLVADPDAGAEFGSGTSFETSTIEDPLSPEPVVTGGLCTAGDGSIGNLRHNIF